MAEETKTDTPAPLTATPVKGTAEEAGTVIDKDGPVADNPTPDAASGNILEGNAPDGLTLTEAEAAAARKEGAKEAAKEAGKRAYQFLTDGNLPGEATSTRFFLIGDVQQEAGLLDLSPENFEKRISEDYEPVPLTEEKVAGLLSLERSGKNRTPYVKAMMARLDVASPYEVTHAGPPYTNDITSNRVEF